jgi:hypothetical protein
LSGGKKKRKKIAHQRPQVSLSLVNECYLTARPELGELIGGGKNGNEVRNTKREVGKRELRE